MRDEFQNWLRGFGENYCQGYPYAIDRLSSHYSIHTGDNIDIYTINDINILKVIVDKYSQNGIFGAKGHEGNGLYRAAIRKYKKFLEEYFKLLPEPKPDAVGTTIMPLTSEEPGENEPATQLRKVEYRSLNGKQKEIFNFHKLAGVLADYGFSCIKLSDDWLGADFLACHIDGLDTMKVQLKSRCTIDKKYSGKNVFIAFPANGSWYLVEHDILVQKVVEKSPSWLKTSSWIDHGCYHRANPGAALLQSLSGHRLESVSPAPQPEEEEGAATLQEPKRRKWWF